ncbi:hypothetical protein [Winogradskyella marincola]|uniref:Uncharacterized protein n=1 Tax=Winogradskyella marincola TaxID=3037795 RepID=A0ABT6G5R2_9FLAO|nr:hypothetical protein [Winogradskyella sp. YYF002]MDG4717333.1 hypothetical protein [Winogradskyella sp. YYF002]
MGNQLNYLQEVNDIILNPKKKELIDILVNFIKTDFELLINESARDRYELEVVTFEFDKPFSFSYVAYPGSNLIPNEYTTINSDFELETHWDELEKIFKDKGFIQGPDGDEWFNTETFDLISEWELCRYMECNWFSDCWKEAKRIASRPNYIYSKLRCFFVEHDVFGGIDADNGRFKTEKEIKATLIKEGLYIEPIYESQFKVHKNDRKELWGTVLESFENFTLAFEYLDNILKKSNDEFAHEDYLIRKWRKIDNNGQEKWILDSSFEKKFLGSRTAKGLLYTRKEYEELNKLK